MSFTYTIKIIFDWMLIITSSFALLSLLNPLTTIPYYFLLHPKAKPEEIKSDGLRIGAVVFLILSISLFIGSYILSFLGLDIIYFKIGGGILIFLMALSMVKGETSAIKLNTMEKNKMKNVYIDKGLIIPLALPLTSGAGSIAYTIGLHDKGLLNGFAAIIIASVITTGVLMYSGILKRILGDIGMQIITRIFGLFMVGIGIQIIISNLKIVFGL